jgi:DNA polymerase-3 subunit gamma/tau
MLQVGAAPEGLTEAARETLAALRDALGAGDVLRMLKLLAEQEGALRRSAQPRLVAETLLLRWALLDRVVDLEQVLAGTGGARRETRDARPVARAPRPAPPDPSPESPDSRPEAALKTDFTLPALAASWSSIVEATRVQSRFLGEALAITEVTGVNPPEIAVRLREANPLFHETLEQKAREVEGILAGIVGAPVRLKVAAAGGTTAAAPARMTEESIRADRLEGLRRRDAALDAAATELDLEIVE